MMKVKQALKIPLLFLAGGLIYCAIELVYRQYTHWAMFILGGVCFLALGLINISRASVVYPADEIMKKRKNSFTK